MANSTGTASKKKTCFVITPIGDNQSTIRRHIDSVINHAIIPALGEEYEPLVPHRLYESTAITKQIYQHLNESDLVIANLTGLNPNVMYELAIRFCVGKPVIIIAEDGTKLPFDVKDHRAIFYINDFDGIVDLKENIMKTLTRVDYSGKPTSPIYDALGEIFLFQQLKNEHPDSLSVFGEAVSLILEKIEDLSNNSTNSKFDTRFNLAAEEETNIQLRIMELKNNIRGKKSITINERIRFMKEINEIRKILIDSDTITKKAYNQYYSDLNKLEDDILYLQDRL